MYTIAYQKYGLFRPMSGAITAGTLATVAGIGAAGSIGGALIGSSSAKSAAKQQSNAADYAAQLQYQQSQDALNFEKQQWQQTQANIAPWLQMGGGALGNLGYLLGVSPNTSLGLPTQVPNGTPINGSGAPSLSGAPAIPRTPMPMSSVAGASPVLGGGPSLATAGTPSLNNGYSGAPAANPVTGGPSLGANPVSSLGGGSLGVPTAHAVTPTGSPITNPAGGAEGSVPGGGFGSLMQGYGQTFQAPDLNETTDPGYQARLKLGTDAVQRSAAARGSLLTGGTLRDLNQFGQDYASNEYNNVYNRALNGFDTNYNIWSNDQANKFNRLAALSGVGQTAAQQLSNAGANTANAVSSNLLGTGSLIGQDYQNAGAANASGIVGAGNAWSGALGGVSNNLTNLLLLKQLGAGGGYSPYGSGGAGMGF